MHYKPLRDKGGRLKKIESRYEDAMFVGVQEGSNIKWILTTTGAVRAWAIKLKPPAEQ